MILPEGMFLESATAFGIQKCYMCFPVVRESVIPGSVKKDNGGQTIRSNFKSIHAENGNLMVGGN